VRSTRVMSRALVAGTLMLSLAPAARAQTGEQADSARVHRLDALVVTAERAAISISQATNAVSVLSARELRLRPVRTLAEALQQAPGLLFLDFDGSGTDPQLVTRGFYGGGEAEYVAVLLDGVPLNQVEGGRVDWELIPVASIESIEVVRGGASAAWGEAALAGAINIITRRPPGSGVRATVTGGQHGTVRASAALSDLPGGRPLRLAGNLTRADGYRVHAQRSSGAVDVSLGLTRRGDHSLSVALLHDWRTWQQPGPLTAQAVAVSRRQVSPFHRFDESEERMQRITLEHRLDRVASRMRSFLTGEFRHVDRIRTIPLAPVFADTKNREWSTARVLGSTQLELPRSGLPGGGALLLGLDGSLGLLDSEYYDFLQGGPDDYIDANPERGALNAKGEVTRTAIAGFAHYALQAGAAVRFTLGGRFDALHDAFEAKAPAAPAEGSATHTAFSPRAGVNIRYADGESHRGHVYANVTGSFKAPALDQLYDQRPVPVPFPPFQITFANDSLKPQRGRSIEAGMNHRAVLAPSLAADLTLAAYHMRMRDEIDFDLQTFSYGNIGRSRHTGIEAGLDLQGPAGAGASATYTLQSATTRIGEHSGNQLKAIPRHFFTAGARTGSHAGLQASVGASGARTIWLDDANTIELPGWTRWDARLTWSAGRIRVFADVHNFTDARYSTTGFPDGADPSVIYYHPAAGRTFRIGLSRDW